jgi:hypothetical protein
VAENGQKRGLKEIGHPVRFFGHLSDFGGI